jgi:hypothetical protein
MDWDQNSEARRGEAEAATRPLHASLIIIPMLG